MIQSLHARPRQPTLDYSDTSEPAPIPLSRPAARTNALPPPPPAGKTRSEGSPGAMVIVDRQRLAELMARIPAARSSRVPSLDDLLDAARRRELRVRAHKRARLFKVAAAVFACVGIVLGGIAAAKYSGVEVHISSHG